MIYDNDLFAPLPMNIYRQEQCDGHVLNWQGNHRQELALLIYDKQPVYSTPHDLTGRANIGRGHVMAMI